MFLPLPRGSQAFECAGSNQGPEHILIPKYQVGQLAHAGLQFIVIKVLCFSSMYISSTAGGAWASIRFFFTNHLESTDADGFHRGGRNYDQG